MGLVLLQANDGQAATKSFDVIASQSVPAAFYAEMRTRKQDRAVKCELNREGLRLIFLSSYDKKGNTAPPHKPAGEDGLGDMVIDPSVAREQQFDPTSWNMPPNYDNAAAAIRRGPARQPFQGMKDVLDPMNDGGPAGAFRDMHDPFEPQHIGPAMLGERFEKQA